MTPSHTVHEETEPSFHTARKRWMKFALAASIALHGGAAVLILVASGSNRSRMHSSSILIEDVALTPSISSPAKTAPAPPPQQPPVLKPSVPPVAATADQSAPAPLPEQPSTSAGSPREDSRLTSTPLGLGMMHGYFSSLADGRTLREDIRSYYFEMVGNINRLWWENAKDLKDPLRQDGIFELLILRDGTIVSVRVMQSTGSTEADRLAADIIKSSSPLPALPSSYELGLFRAPLRIKAPSFVFR